MAAAVNRRKFHSETLPPALLHPPSGLTLVNAAGGQLVNQPNEEYTREGDMSDLGYHCQMLDESSRRPELMDRMIERMLVNLSVAGRIDGGMALDEARTKCIFCRHEGDCRCWLDGSEMLRGPADFCPNVEFFQQCAETSAHSPRAAT